MTWLVWISAETEGDSGWIGVDGRLVDRWVDARVYELPMDALNAGDALAEEAAIVCPAQLEHVVQRLGGKPGSAGALVGELVRGHGIQTWPSKRRQMGSALLATVVKLYDWGTAKWGRS